MCKVHQAPKLTDISLCKFITASPTPFQAVHNLSKRLLSEGFSCISERASPPPSLSPGGKYFYTRNQSSIVAFTLPPKPTSTTAISFAVGHLDSPCLKVRPISKKSKAGYLQVGVELYGGGIWSSWFDRDLSLAGRVIVSTSGTGSGSGSEGKSSEGFTSKLVKIDRPLLRIPTLAIHLDRTMNDQFKFNKETEFLPILGLVADTLNGKDGKKSGTPFSGQATPVEGEKQNEGVFEDIESRHHPLLLAVLADELGCSIGDIQDFEL
jgi:aspartyl aminopeptidase